MENRLPPAAPAGATGRDRQSHSRSPTSVVWPPGRSGPGGKKALLCRALRRPRFSAIAASCRTSRRSCWRPTRGCLLIGAIFPLTTDIRSTFWHPFLQARLKIPLLSNRDQSLKPKPKESNTGQCRRRTSRAGRSTISARAATGTGSGRSPPSSSNDRGIEIISHITLVSGGVRPGRPARDQSHRAHPPAPRPRARLRARQA